MSENRHVEIRAAQTTDIEEIVDLAARTFGLACPPHMPQADIDLFISEKLNPAAFEAFLAADDHRLVVGISGESVIAYSLLIDQGDTTFISKFYVAPESHGNGMATRLMNEAKAFAAERGASRLQLAVNKFNERALRFYEKSGFQVAGYRDFVVGSQVENDYILEHELAGAKSA